MEYKTITEIKKEIKKFYGVAMIHVSIGSYEEENEFDVNVNVWAYDRYNNKEFDCFTITLDNEKDAIKRAKSIATNLSNTYKKVKYVGIENC